MKVGEFIKRKFDRLASRLWRTGARGDLRSGPPDTYAGPADHVEAYVYVFYFNVLVTGILSTRFLGGMPDETTLAGWLVILVALVSNSLFLNTLASAVCLPLTLAIRRKWFTVAVLPILFGLLNFYVYADAVLFSVQRLHFNGVVLRMALYVGENFTVGTRTWVSGFFAGFLIIVLELVFGLVTLPRIRRSGFFKRFRNRKWLMGAVALIFAVTLVDKVIYIGADILDRSEFMRAKYIFPLYQAATAKRWCKKWLGIEVSSRSSFRVEAGGSALRYPKAAIRFPEGHRRPNIIIIVIESFRPDTFQPDVMPFLYEWSKKHIVGRRHFTGGNRSTHGIFSAMYGIYSTYWNRFLCERQGPVLVSELKEQGYNFKVLASANTSFSEGPKTSFVEIREAIEDQWDRNLTFADRDPLVAQRLIDFAQSGRQPFFAFLWFSSPHQPYWYPAEHEAFPVDLKAEDINYVRLAASNEQLEGMLKRCKNSLHFVDSLLKRIITCLETQGLMENTLLFIMADHGEEFGETDLYGHGSQFSMQQIGTAFVAHVPDIGPLEIRHLTSHVDVVPTIFKYMGVENPVSDYSHGVPLEPAEGSPFVVVGSLYDAAIVDDESITVFGLEAYNAGLTVRDYNYDPLPDQDEARKKRSGHLMKVLSRLKDFLQ